MRIATIGMICFLISLPRIVLSQSFTVDTLHAREIRIDPSQANGAELADLASSVEYIPLETTGKSYFGKIDRFEIVNNKFIIYDGETDAILIFDTKGRFINKINSIPNTKMSKGSRSLTSFSVDRVRKQIVILAVTADYKLKLAVFDVTGKYISTADVKPADPLARFNMFYALGNNNYTYANTLYNVPKNLIVPDEDKRFELLWGTSPALLYYRFLPFDFTHEVTGSDAQGASFYHSGDTSAFYIKSFRYSVYKVSPHSVKRDYHFVFPYSMTLPETFFTDKLLDGKRDAYLERHNKFITTIDAFYQAGDHLLFSIKSQEALSVVGSMFLYSLKSEMLYALENLAPAEMNNYLPLFAESEGIHVADNNAVYTSVSSAMLLKSKEQMTPDRIRKFPPELKKFFSKATVKENPVIIKVSIKSDI